MKRYNLSDEKIQSLLNEGYSLSDIELAADLSNRNQKPLEESILDVKPQIVNTSKEIAPVIVDRTGGIQYSPTNIISSTPTDATEALNKVNTKPNEAPYSINLENEILSTLSGNLSVRAVDFTLPGRNGLSFSLERIYDSQSSQYYDMDYDFFAGNLTTPSYQDKLFPIGKGWSWNISSIKIVNDKKYLHLADVGTFELTNNNEIKGYQWNDLTFSENTTVQVNGETSAYLLSSVRGIKQYFNSEGKLIRIADLYGNTIDFHYSTVDQYGKVLTSIHDAIGNSIVITYSENKVTLQRGNQTVTYIKTTQNGVELLAQVWDPIGRATTYHYTLSPAQFNLVGTSPIKDNPYALLTGITHPTGAKTEYTYENNPYTRYIAENAVNQVYRVVARKDLIYYSDGSTSTHNYKTIEYAGDVGSSYGADLSFNVTVKKYLNPSTGSPQLLATTTYTNEKDYIDPDTPEVYYKTEEVIVSGSEKWKYTYAYDRARRASYVPITITKQYSKNNNNGQMFTIHRTYDDFGNMTSETLPGNIQTLYEYDASTGLLKTITEPVNATLKKYTVYTRNAQGSITSIKVYENNASGRLLQRIDYGNFDSYGNAREINIYDNNRTIRVQLAYTSATNFAFPSTQTLSVTNVDGTADTFSRQYSYDIRTGDLTQYTDGKGYITSYQYDNLGRIKKVIHPGNASIQFVYDDFNNTLKSIDETGVINITKWNPLGWRIDEGIEVDNQYKSKAKYGYDSLGRLIWEEDALGHRTSYSYDSWDRQIQTTYADQSYETITYDDISLTKTVTDPEGEAVRETYDIFDRLTKWEELTSNSNIVRQYTYDYRDNIVTQIEDNQSTIYTYDALSRLTSVRTANNEVTQYSYDLLGNLVTITFPDNKTKANRYDELGRLIETTDANGKKEKFYYDRNDNLERMIDRNGKQFTYVYTNRNFLWKRTAPDGTIEYLYDDAGRRITMKDQGCTQDGVPVPVCTTQYVYNPKSGLLEKIIYPDSKTIEYHYDEQGNRIAMKDPFGYNIIYQYDARNRLIGVGPTIGEYEAQYQYYKNSLLKTITQRNGIVSSYTYDGLRLDTLTHKKADQTVLNSFNYDYDKHGNIISITENGRTYTFSYDLINRIKTSSQFNETYNYDARGNRSSLQTTLQMDHPAYTYTYDDRDQLKSVTVNGVTVTYKYNGDGLLVERSENGKLTRYYYDGDLIIAEAEVVNGTATLKARYIRGIGLIARESSTSEKSYYLHNGHGDIVELRDDTGQTRLNRYQYDIWGKPVLKEESIENPFLYSGELWDSTSNLQYLRARWYDPRMGRFISEDTYEGQISNPLSLNLYTYAHNNPLLYIDPTGNAVETVVDLLSLGWSIYDLWRNPTLTNFGFFLWDIAATIIPLLPGSYTAKSAKILMKAEDFAKSTDKGVWAENPLERGRLIEEKLGAMNDILGNNFKTIDKFERRPGSVYADSITSIKSIDVTLKTYNQGNNFYNRLRSYVDDVANYNTHTQLGTTVTADAATKRYLEVALPPVQLTQSQAEQLQKAFDYAKSVGVEIIVKIVK
jgi:RHS repeat-associated protein